MIRAVAEEMLFTIKDYQKLSSQNFSYILNHITIFLMCTSFRCFVPCNTVTYVHKYMISSWGKGRLFPVRD